MRNSFLSSYLVLPNAIVSEKIQRRSLGPGHLSSGVIFLKMEKVFMFKIGRYSVPLETLINFLFGGVDSKIEDPRNS